MRLSVVVPVFNEIGTLAEIIRRVAQADLGIPKEIVIVDDYSTDGSREYLARLSEGGAALPGGVSVRVLFHDKNMGKGAAIRTALEAASGDIVLTQDADLEYDPADYPALLAPILDGRADVVYGSRLIGGGTHRVLFFWHYVGNRFLTLLCNMLSNLNLSDMETCYKVFRRDVLKRITLRSDRFGFEPEVTMKVAKLRCRIYEVPISYAGRTYAEGKKITWKDGLAALFHILWFRLTG